MPEQPELLVTDVVAWRSWLDSNEDVSDGVWLVLAKKGSTTPTSLTYSQALLEALCSGWIDGQTKSKDAATYAIRFTPRRRRSLWSARNVGYVAQLTAEGRMRPRGVAEVDAAKADGRWERAYAGPATAKIPDDLAEALAARPPASAAFNALKSQERFAVLFQLMTASDDATRARRLATQLQKLETRTQED
ncbi:MAG: hypothetical protein CVT64_09125 [Actinobacteria bacterium HGW-Actinobacteria-4]|nr:MAG: hypothetical protein CVT64_09125 [Actinobacteria bacterium HGW-Actinobacteria-4]